MMNGNWKQFLAYLWQQMDAGLPLGVWSSEPATAELSPALRSLASDDSEPQFVFMVDYFDRFFSYFEPSQHLWDEAYHGG
ncbi:olfactory receptor [Cricetulus griseus]|nr:olfactory receptor [Cricetulus griseus]